MTCIRHRVCTSLRKDHRGRVLPRHWNLHTPSRMHFIEDGSTASARAGKMDLHTPSRMHFIEDARVLPEREPVGLAYAIAYALH